MKMKALILAGLMLGASSAQAATIAGWDFSQYTDGFLSVDGATLSDGTLDANWADLDTVGAPGLGAGANAFGDLNLGITPTGADPIVPTSATLGGGSLTSNNDTPAAGVMDFTSTATLQADGQTLWNDVALRVDSALDIVFQASLSSIGQIGNGWSLQLAGQTAALGETSTIGAALSTDGVNFGATQNLSVNQADSLLVADFLTEGDGSDTVFIRLSFDGVSTFIDNVTILADPVVATPEPSVALLFAGLAGLAVFGRRK